MTQDRPTVRQRLRAALTAFRTPDALKSDLPEAEVGLPPHLWAWLHPGPPSRHDPRLLGRQQRPR